MVVKLSKGHIEAKRGPLTEVPAGTACSDHKMVRSNRTTLNVSAVSTDDHNR